jgi:hypothetical protein
LQFRECNKKPCSEFYRLSSEGKFLQCGSKVDLMVLMDGSGSLGNKGWQNSQKFVTNLISHLEGSDDKVHVALQLFSGPRTWTSYAKCTGTGSGAPDMETDCGITWVKHFTNDTIATAKLVNDLKFPRATTLTSVALAEAKSELINGREDAASIVVVVTDGKPLSHERTVAAANALKADARVIWVPVGPGAPLDLIDDLASLPKHENIIQMDSFDKLGWPYFVNKVISQACPVLEKPAGCKATVYEDANFQGKSKTFDIGFYDHPVFTRHPAPANDKVSSLKVEGGPTCRAELYQHGGFKGWKASYGPGEYTDAAFTGPGAKNDDASSMKVIAG